ncbi:ADYC domain-containing protein [Nannocystis sp. SCPEA4]|uniref:ADYC domain-containing protein n=1 Tax=Nannocystis sp. SCPEA4 TaxID=2996787 RepID=UPI00226EAD9B|nr:ADYC domain-containing protein [Nannocystis sp. SCPEA4]MCY1061804.1 ADYC domain-containing protein [Nannocystis sp. SCPEA4]
MLAHFARFLPLSAALLAMTAAACTYAPEDEQSYRDSGTLTVNSPEIDDAPFPELSLSGQPNSAGVSLVGLRDPNGNLHPLATNSRDELVVYDDNHNLLFSGDDLVDWTLVLEKDGVEVEGTILTYDGDVPGWTDDGRPITTYAISFPGTAADPGHKNVCPTYRDEPLNPVLTIIRGATYDRELKEVDLIDADWVTFACADQAAYKAKALGYHQGENFAGTTAPATRDQQDATLKMITADYCGTGHSFTVQGTAIHWENSARTVTIAPGTVYGYFEAIWGKDGAICLNDPRAVDRSEVEAECDIPLCPIDWETTSHEWATWKPLQ